MNAAAAAAATAVREHTHVSFTRSDGVDVQTPVHSVCTGTGTRLNTCASVSAPVASASASVAGARVGAPVASASAPVAGSHVGAPAGSVGAPVAGFNAGAPVVGASGGTPLSGANVSAPIVDVIVGTPVDGTSVGPSTNFTSSTTGSSVSADFAGTDYASAGIGPDKSFFKCFWCQPQLRTSPFYQWSSTYS